MSDTVLLCLRQLRSEQIVIAFRGQPVPPVTGLFQLLCPSRINHRFSHQHLADFVVIARDLDRQYAARGEEGEKPRDECFMATQPLQRRIGIDDVIEPIRPPRRDIGRDESRSDAARARFAKHFGG